MKNENSYPARDQCESPFTLSGESIVTDELLKDLLELARALPDPVAFHELLEIIAEIESDEYDESVRTAWRLNSFNTNEVGATPSRTSVQTRQKQCIAYKKNFVF